MGEHGETGVARRVAPPPLIAPRWWWLAAALVLGVVAAVFDRGRYAPWWVHLAVCLAATYGAERARIAVLSFRARRCPHPGHRIRHIHQGHARRAGVAQCMDCFWYFRDWPGGDHDATRCWPG